MLFRSKESTVLESRQNELKQDLQKKLIIAEKLKNEIARIIAEEQRKLAEQRRQAALAAAAKKAEEAKKAALAKKTAAAKTAVSKSAATKAIPTTPVAVKTNVEKPTIIV